MSGHIDTIECPHCGSIQDAEVEHTRPFWTYIHECACGYIITESEWFERNTLPGKGEI